MDEGPILANVKLRITNDEMHSALRDRLAHAGAELLVKTIPDYIAGKIAPHEQDHSQATYTKLFTRDDGKVDLKNDTPHMIYNKFRAFEGWPGIWFIHRGKRVKVLSCRIIDGILDVMGLQPEGKRPMSLRDFVNGYGNLL